VLSQNKGRKILVFQPMIELGTYAESSHREVGQYAARVVDEIILTNPNFSEFFLEGVRSVTPEKKVHIFSGQRAAKYLSSRISAGSMVLFKGKEAEPILNLLLAKK